LITFLVLPLSVTGVVFGQLVTGTEFGFFSIAGWLGLLGMLIKNVIKYFTNIGNDDISIVLS